ncbi:hypothetical protein [Streptomyces shaanxiensis]|uniref:hypothetical protein n=1 Tax=Streptomyces shaanxiensis TaxID=653357 RepID=UPI0031F0FF3A
MTGIGIGIGIGIGHARLAGSLPCGVVSGSVSLITRITWITCHSGGQDHLLSALR